MNSTKLTDFSERQLKLMYRVAQDEKMRLREHLKGISAIPSLKSMFKLEIEGLLLDINEIDLWIVQLGSALKEIILREKISDN